jgi:hypothetical protein
LYATAKPRLPLVEYRFHAEAAKTSRSSPKAVMAALIGHAIYGILLCAITGDYLKEKLKEYSK